MNATVFTLLLVISTTALWGSTRDAAYAAKIAAEHIPNVERAYLSGGGAGAIFESHATGSAPDGSGTSCGYECHTIVKARDYVFTAYGKR